MAECIIGLVGFTCFADESAKKEDLLGKKKENKGKNRILSTITTQSVVPVTRRKEEILGQG